MSDHQEVLPPEAGHNNPPESIYDTEVHEELSTKVQDFLDAAERAVKKGEITDDDYAGKLQDFITGCRKLAAKIDATRKAQKQPHTDRGKQVDAAYNPLKERITGIIIPKVMPLLTAYSKKKAEAAEAARKEAEAKAAEAQREADLKLALAQQSGSLAAEAEAADLVKAAEAEAKQAAKVGAGGGKVKSATGAGRTGSLRTRKIVGEITDINQLMLRYRERAEMIDLCTRLANAELRAAGGPDAIPGCTVKTEETFV